MFIRYFHTKRPQNDVCYSMCQCYTLHHLLSLFFTFSLEICPFTSKQLKSTFSLCNIRSNTWNLSKKTQMLTCSSTCSDAICSSKSCSNVILPCNPGLIGLSSGLAAAYQHTIRTLHKAHKYQHKETVTWLTQLPHYKSGTVLKRSCILWPQNKKSLWYTQTKSLSLHIVFNLVTPIIF